MLRVAAGKDARHVGHQGLRVRDDEAVVVFDPAAVEDGQVGALTGGEDDVIGFERQQPAGVELRIEVALLVAGLLAELQGELTILTDADRPPARVQLHAFGDGIFDLVRAGRHVAAFLERGEVDVLRALPQSRQGHVDGDVAAADDDDPWPDAHRIAAAHGMQEVDAAEHEGLMDTLDRDEARSLGAEPEEHRVVILAKGLEAADRGAGVDGDTQRPDLVDLLIEQIRRQAIGRNAIAQLPAGLLQRLEDLDLHDRRCAGNRPP